MINLTLSGGLGNQLFEYAYARALSEELGDPEIVINPYFNRLFKLYLCAIKAYPSYVAPVPTDLFILNPNVRQIAPTVGFASATADILVGSLIRFGIYKPDTNAEKYKEMTEKGKFKMLDREYTYFEHGDCTKTNKSVLGWFQTDKYFSHIRPILLKELQFKTEPSKKNQEMIEELSSCNSVCVHIRRGDLSNPHFAYFTRPTEEYYRKGIEYISERTENPVFYIFSNNHEDIEWIKQNYDFGVPLQYVDLNNLGHEDLRLMYYCKHFVISKSTFSWWGSYMSQNKGKIVVAPEMEIEPCWLKDTDMDGFYRDDMIRIPVNLKK